MLATAGQPILSAEFCSLQDWSGSGAGLTSLDSDLVMELHELVVLLPRDV
jgi:hypothetical protein